MGFIWCFVLVPSQRRVLKSSLARFFVGQRTKHRQSKDKKQLCCRLLPFFRTQGMFRRSFFLFPPPIGDLKTVESNIPEATRNAIQEVVQNTTDDLSAISVTREQLLAKAVGVKLNKHNWKDSVKFTLHETGTRDIKELPHAFVSGVDNRNTPVVVPNASSPDATTFIVDADKSDIELGAARFDAKQIATAAGIMESLGSSRETLVTDNLEEFVGNVNADSDLQTAVIDKICSMERARHSIRNAKKMWSAVCRCTQMDNQKLRSEMCDIEKCLINMGLRRRDQGRGNRPFWQSDRTLLLTMASEILRLDIKFYVVRSTDSGQTSLSVRHFFPRQTPALTSVCIVKIENSGIVIMDRLPDN